MKIAIGQVNLTVGDIENNLRQIETFIQKAIDNSVSLIVFPEQLTTVKGAKDLLFSDVYIKKSYEIRKMIEKYSGAIAIVFGDIQKKDDKFQNCAFLAYENSLVKLATQSTIKSEDLIYFEPNIYNYIFKIDDIKFSIALGDEEVRNTDADYLINLNSKPFVKQSKSFCVREKTIYVNHVGLSDCDVYNGGSCFIDENGEIIVSADYLKSQLLVFDLKATKAIQSVDIPMEQKLFDTMSFAFKEFCRINKFEKAVIGLSGGIDSALTAVILCDAIGAENVLGITMPSKYSTEGSYLDSYELADNLGMECKTIPIKPLFDVFVNDIQDKTYLDLAEENLQARLRGNILMTYSNRENRVLVSTGNKSESAMGYCTLYGDMAGGINLIADLYKLDVYGVSKWINRNREIIPVSIIEKAPSAELRPNQKDQDSLPDYEILDDILLRYIENGETVDNISKSYDEKLVKDIVNKLNGMEFKRNQATFSIRLSSQPLFRRNFPIVNKFRY